MNKERVAGSGGRVSLQGLQQHASPARLQGRTEGSCCPQTQGVSSTGQTRVRPGLVQAGKSFTACEQSRLCVYRHHGHWHPAWALGEAFHGPTGSKGGGQGSEDSRVRNGKAGVTLGGGNCRSHRSPGAACCS